jgi:arabinogalactan oligomer / maltooligosaccharide transport system permease protein
VSSLARRHASLGLAVAGLLGIIAAWALLGAWRSSGRGFEARREAVVSGQALAELVTEAGLQGDTARAAVSAFTSGSPDLRWARVIIFEGLSLEASTAPDDVGERVAPRRLTKEEKPLYDQGQRLRSAVDTNREDQASMKEEIEVTAAPDGGLEVATPLLKEGSVVGFVALQVAPKATAAPRGPWLPALGILAGMFVVFLGLAAMLPDRRLLLCLVGFVVLIAGLVGYATLGANTLAADRESAERAVTSHLQHARDKVRAVAESLKLPALPGGSQAWDVDAFHKPYGTLTATGELDTSKLRALQAATASEFRSSFWLLGGVAALVFLFFSTGLGAATWRIIVGNRAAYLYVMPAMLGMMLLVFFPFFYGIALSFTSQTIYNTDKSIPDIWIGLQNFKEIITDVHVAQHTAQGWSINYQNFYWTLWVTVAWTVSNVAIGVSVGLMLALILNIKGLRFRPIYRVLLILPWAVPNYITALIWKGMFHQQFGVVNQVLQMVGLPAVSWFEKPFSSFMTCLATNAWLSFPFMMVISLGALQSIPADLYEAARVDGATRWRQFTSITLPSLKPALVPAVILSVVWTFNMFNIIYLVSAGEPAHSTEILITQAYKLAFEQYRYGYAAAYSTVIFLILLMYGTWQNRVTKATEGI